MTANQARAGTAIPVVVACGAYSLAIYSWPSLIGFWIATGLACGAVLASGITLIAWDRQQRRDWARRQGEDTP